MREIAEAVAGLGNGSGSGNGSAEIGVQITELTDAMPSPEDIEQVEARLVSHHGWPLDDE